MFAGRYHGESDGSYNRGDTWTYRFSPPIGEWDLVRFPVFEDAPDTGPAPSRYYSGIPKNSRRKQEAFQLILHLLSEDVQQANSRYGLASVRKDPAIHAEFGAQDALLLDKNRQAFLRHAEEGSHDPEYNWLLHRYGMPYSHYVESGSMYSGLHRLNDFLQSRLEKAGAAQ